MPGPFYFAWAGGTIADPVTVVTTGSTHGGAVETINIVADMDAGEPQLFNIATLVGLEFGMFYGVEGPGLPSADTHFIFDEELAVAETSFANLTRATSDTLRSAGFIVTKSIDIAQCAGTVLKDHNFIVLTEPLDLPPGEYGIRGDSIGLTDMPFPEGTNISGAMPQITVPSAIFQYSGGTSIELFVMVKNQGSVARQPAKCNDTGTFPFIISGMPTADWYSVTSIPAAALAGLVPGLQYNVYGNGIPAGTSFIAPGSGATAIELDQPATSAQLGAILTITGPRTPNAPFDPAVHNRFDEEVLSIQIEQNEGDFATLTMDIKNQGIGLLATGRNLWCWLSWDQAWTPEGGADPDLVPLFNGRLAAIPKLAAGEIIQLQFVARPDDFIGQKRELADSMKVLPFWDPVWLSNNPGNPDTVLEGYSALWHIDRITLEVTTSDILVGEDGIVTIGEDQSFYDAFSLAMGDGAPLRQISISGTVAWVQEGEGIVDVTPKLNTAFREAGNYTSNTFGYGSTLASGSDF